jgi:hypothetical protein
MLRSLAVTLFAFGLLACTEIAAPPDGGTGGSSGVGGEMGGTGGTGGVGGEAGQGGMGEGGTGGLDPCAVLKEGGMTEANDMWQWNVATGTVSGDCSSGSCSGDDPVDHWQLTSCESKYSIVLTWTEVSDLDLHLLDSDRMPIASSTERDTMTEVIFWALEGALHFIEVQAYDTGGGPQSYRLEVSTIE